MQNHFLQVLITCQATMTSLNKPYDDELCRLALYQTLECFLLNERADCPTLLPISKNLIDSATNLDGSIQVKMAVRKLKLVWQQVHDSINHLYHPWSSLNIDKPRKTLSNPANDLQHIFMSNNIPPVTSTNSEPVPMETAPVNSYLVPPAAPPVAPVAPPTLSTTSTVEVTVTSHVEQFVQPMNNEHRREQIEDHGFEEHQRKRAKLVDTRPVPIVDDDDEEDDDGAERKNINVFVLDFTFLFQEFLPMKTKRRRRKKKKKLMMAKKSMRVTKSMMMMNGWMAMKLISPQPKTMKMDRCDIRMVLKNSIHISVNVKMEKRFVSSHFFLWSKFV